jgi:hypothetical protein
MVFNLVILVITSDSNDPVIFGIFSEETIMTISRQSLTFVFMGCAAVSFLTSILAFYLVFQKTKTDHRLVICGFNPLEILSGKLVNLILIVIAISLYESLLLCLFLEPENFFQLFTGFFLAGLIYGCYGLFIGAISRHELEGLFLIILVANIDIGWLQNPLFYAESTNKTVIEFMPGFYPTQLANLGAFTNEFVPSTIWGSLIYSMIFLSLAIIAFVLKVKSRY